MDSEKDNEKKKNFTLRDWIETKNNLKKSFKYVKNNKKNLIMGAIIALLEVPISILNPILTSKIVLNLNEKIRPQEISLEEYKRIYEVINEG